MYNYRQDKDTDIKATIHNSVIIQLIIFGGKWLALFVVHSTSSMSV